MRFKLDENLPASLIPLLEALGHEVDSVRDEGLTGEPDATVFVEAQKAGRALITQDLDFSDIRAFAPGTHAGLVLVRLASPGRRALLERLVQAFDQEDAESWARSFVVITDQKVRIRRPPASEGAL
ncbi:MAG: DUF5615 family PIN-like protein [Myxococcota bacterium]